VFVSLLFYQQFGWALATFVAAGVSDGLDGLIARTFNQFSELGKILDPIADKLLMTAAFVFLSFPFIVAGNNLPIPFWLTAAVISRDILIIVVAGAIFMTTSFRGFRPSLWGKISTIVQISAVGLILLAATAPFFCFYLPVVYFTVFFFTVISGIHYIFFVNRLMKTK
jgi:cardiolipin synthase